MISDVKNIVQAVVALLGQNVPFYKTERLSAVRQRIYTTDTYWYRTLKSATVNSSYEIEIDGVTFAVESVERNEYFDIITESGYGLIANGGRGTMNLDAVSFKSGTVSYINDWLNNIGQTAGETLSSYTPLVVLLEPISSEPEARRGSVLAEIADIQLLIVAETDENASVWNTDDHYSYVIEPMEDILKAMNALFPASTSISRHHFTPARYSNHINIGNPPDKPDKQTFDVNFSGIQARGTLHILKDACGNAQAPAAASCPSFNDYFSAASAETISTQLDLLDQSVQDEITELYCPTLTTLIDEADALTIANDIQASGGTKPQDVTDLMGLCDTLQEQIDEASAATTRAAIVASPNAAAIKALLIADYTQLELNTGISQTKKDLIYPRMPLKTGQTLSRLTGDDGDTERGYGGTAFTLLPSGQLNPFGNNARFTDSVGNGVGLAALVDNARCDWATGLMWYNNLTRPVMTLANAIIDAQAFSYLGYSDWELPNLVELETLRNWADAGSANVFANYQAFLMAGGFLWTSTESTLTNGLVINAGGRAEAVAKTNTYSVPLVRRMIL